jgi:hypothetical protein
LRPNTVEKRNADPSRKGNDSWLENDARIGVDLRDRIVGHGQMAIAKLRVNPNGRTRPEERTMMTVFGEPA